MSPARTVLLVVGGIAVVGALGVGTSYAVSGDTVARGVRVGSVDLGGQDRAEARAAVQAAFAGRATAPVQVVVDGVPKTLDPAASGLSLDADAVVDDAVSGGPVDRLRGLLGAERQVEPRAAVDEDELRTAVTRLKDQVDRAPREGAVRFKDGATPYALPPVTGRDLDLDGTVTAVSQAYLRDEDPVELPVEVTPVKSTAADVQRVLTEVAQPAVSAPITLDVDGKALVVTPADLAAGLTLEADATGAIAPEVDGAKVLKALGDRVEPVQSEPTDARLRISDGKPVVVPAVTGKTVQPGPLGTALLSVLTRPAPRTAPLELQVEQPELTTAEAGALGVKEVIGTFTTRFPCCRPRVTQHPAHRRDRGQHAWCCPATPSASTARSAAAPRPTASSTAPQILKGEFVDDVGGGVSQFATTMFNAVFFSGLDDVEHKAHSYYITRYPAGREATVFFPSVDLKWRNDSRPRRPRDHLDDRHLGHGHLLGHQAVRGRRRSPARAPASARSRRSTSSATTAPPPRAHEGFDITVTRVFKQGGKVVRREPFTTRYQPEPNFICGPPPPGTPASQIGSTS